MSFFSSFLKGSVAAIAFGATSVCLAASAKKRAPMSSAEMIKAITELQSQVAAFQEREKIQEVYVNYGRGIDRLDEEAYSRLANEAGKRGLRHLALWDNP